MFNVIYSDGWIKDDIYFIPNKNLNINISLKEYGNFSLFKDLNISKINELTWKRGFRGLSFEDSKEIQEFLKDKIWRYCSIEFHSNDDIKDLTFFINNIPDVFHEIGIFISSKLLSLSLWVTLKFIFMK